MTEKLAANPADISPGQLSAWKQPANGLFLTGFMGAGKSTVGRELASLLHWQLIDLDERIECHAGDTIANIFASRGEAYFRELERDVLSSNVNSRLHNAVVALGGGTIAQPANLPLLKSTGWPVIFLDAPIQELRSRCARTTNRPLLRGEREFRALYERRLPYYRQAHFRVSTKHKSVHEIAREIARRIGFEVTL